MDVYSKLESEELQTIVQPIYKDLNVCVGKEWYRFPSSFYLPSPKWHLRFVRSEFRGQLPKPYSEHRNGTWTVPEDMNDMNREEPSRYVSPAHLYPTPIPPSLPLPPLPPFPSPLPPLFYHMKYDFFLSL